MGSQSYTEYLREKYASDFKLATEHPFLIAAGDGSIDKSALILWLRQDYLFAYLGGIKFSSVLLSHIPLPVSPPTEHSSPREKALAQAVRHLTFSLSNLTRETDFFLQMSEDHDLQLRQNGLIPDVQQGGLNGPYEEVTKSYIDFLVSTASGGTIEEGLIVLWASELIYFTAWDFAKKHVPSTPPADTKQKALRKFVDNWTCDEFINFVKGLTEMIDGLGIDPDSDVGRRVEEAYKRTVLCEQKFWPSV